MNDTDQVGPDSISRRCQNRSPGGVSSRERLALFPLVPDSLSAKTNRFATKQVFEAKVMFSRMIWRKASRHSRLAT